MNRKKCAHCDPYPYDFWLHAWGKLGKILFPVQYLLNAFDRFFGANFPNFLSFFNKVFIDEFFKINITVGLLREADVSENDERLSSRIVAIIRAARERNIEVKALKIFGRWDANLFSLKKGREKIIFEGLPSIKIQHISLFDFDDKFAMEQILRKNNMPSAEGRAFHSLKAGLLYARRLGFPSVVKPRCGSLSKHTICDIQSEQTLIKAIRIVQEISREFILEKFIPGNVYRITIINNDFIACCLREPPNVVGDGVGNIKELAEIKNKDPLRSDISQKNFTLHKISLDEKAILMLKSRGLTLKSVLPKNKKVYLHDKVVLACGADIHDRTDDVHPDNKQLFLRLSQILGTPIVGIDFICRDVSKPYSEQQCAIIEANSLPYIDMHHFPVSGKPRDVAGRIVDNVFKK